MGTKSIMSVVVVEVVVELERVVDVEVDFVVELLVEVDWVTVVLVDWVVELETVVVVDVLVL